MRLKRWQEQRNTYSPGDWQVQGKGEDHRKPHMAKDGSATCVLANLGDNNSNKYHSLKSSNNRYFISVSK